MSISTGRSRNVVHVVGRRRTKHHRRIRTIEKEQTHEILTIPIYKKKETEKIDPAPRTETIGEGTSITGEIDPLRKRLRGEYEAQKHHALDYGT